MKFKFKKRIYEELIICIIFNLILISILAFVSNFSHNSIIVVIITLSIFNISTLKHIYKIKTFIKNHSIEEINKLEKELNDNYLIYDNWYLTNEYMFSIKKLKKINYKEIVVVENGLTFINRGKNSQLGLKQTIYLKNGEKYKLKSYCMDTYSDVFTDFIKQKNSSTYFGFIEEYLKIKKDNKF